MYFSNRPYVILRGLVLVIQSKRLDLTNIKVLLIYTQKLMKKLQKNGFMGNAINSKPMKKFASNLIRL